MPRPPETGHDHSHALPATSRWFDRHRAAPCDAGAARVTKDDTYVIGSALPNVPTHSGRLWSMYEIDDGPLGGLGFGGGLTYVGERAANLKQQVVYTMPGYTTVDLAAYYQANDHVRFSLNADNVFDKRYYIGSGTWQTTDTPMVNVGEPFTIMGRLQVTY